MCVGVALLGAGCRDLSGKDGGVDGGSAMVGPDDAGFDAGASTDAGHDAGVDAGLSVDAGPDGGLDAGADAGPADAGPSDAGADAGMPDAGPDGFLTDGGWWVFPDAGYVRFADGGTALLFVPTRTAPWPGTSVDEVPLPDGGSPRTLRAWAVRVPDGGAGFMTGVFIPLDGGRTRVETLGHLHLTTLDGGRRPLRTVIASGEPGDGTQAGVVSADVDESGTVTLEDELSSSGPLLDFDQDGSPDFFARPVDAGFTGTLRLPAPTGMPPSPYRRERVTWRVLPFGGLDGGPRNDGGFVWDGGLTDGGWPDVPVGFLCVEPGSGASVERVRQEDDTAQPGAPEHSLLQSYFGICGPRLARPPGPAQTSGAHPYAKLLALWAVQPGGLPVCRLCTSAVLSNPDLVGAFPGLRPLPAFDPANVRAEVVPACNPCLVGQPSTASVRVSTTDPNAIIWLTAAEFSAQEPLQLAAPVRSALVPRDITAAQVASAGISFTCTRRGTAELSAHVFGRVFITAKKNVQCERRGLRRGKDAIFLADVTRIVKNGTGWTSMGTGVTANVISPTAPVEAQFSPVTNDSVLYEGVTAFNSIAGLSPLTLRSGRQTATATFTAGRYAITGLVGQPAFNTSDTFTVEAMRMGSPVSLSVPAPPPLPAPAQLFGPRAGLRTEVRLPDGSFDTLYTFVVATSPRGGFAGLNRLVAAADLPLVMGNRVSPLFSEDDVATLTTWGLTVTSVYVAALREVDGSTFFPGTETPLQAGRMVQATLADFAP